MKTDFCPLLLERVFLAHSIHVHHVLVAFCSRGELLPPANLQAFAEALQVAPLDSFQPPRDISWEPS